MADLALTGWLLEGRPIAANWLSLATSCSLEEARERMTKYKRAHPEVAAKYVLAGKKASTGLRSFQLIDEDKLEDCKRDFDVDCSLQLYSLQQTVSSSSTQQLVYSLLQQVADFLGTEEGTEKFVNRGALQAANLNVKPPGQRIRACTELHRLDGGETKGPSAFSTNKVATGVSEKKKATSVQNFFGAGGGSSGGAKMAEKKDAGKPPLPSSVVLGLDPTKVIPSPKKDLKRAPRGNDGSPSEGVLTAIVEEDEEDEWDDGSGYKTDKKNVHKRGKIVVEEEDEDVEDRPPIDITLTEEDKELIARYDYSINTCYSRYIIASMTKTTVLCANCCHRQLGTEKPAKVGAMDVFVSDSTTQVIGGLKKKKKKLVEKVC